jgi:uncharacterized lipoprotein YddW (UPF0748 family)
MIGSDYLMTVNRIRLGFVCLLVLIATFLNFGKGVSAETNAVSPTPKHEMRAAWIATVQNIDMKSGMDETEYSQWVDSTLKELKAMNFNTVVFQVKATADAFYPSQFAPWSKYITGKKQGTDPGYDPLKIMVEKAHKDGIEIQAWVNPYRVTMPREKLSDLASNNVAIEHPEWVVKYGSQYYLNPGIPEVKNYLIDTVKELVKNYDIDAVHMDDYFYPYRIAGVPFPDQETFEKYGNGYTNIEDWRRNNVSQLVKEMNQSIKEIKPWVQLGISPFGVWRNSADDPTGSMTQAGQTDYDDLYADTRQWIKDGSIDYITPQIYWSRSLAVANYSILLDWWSHEVTTYDYVHPVNLYIGLADYKVGNNFDQAWNNPYELPGQILDNRANGIAMGQMHFSLRQIEKDALGYADILKNDVYNYQALTPAAPWNGAAVPQKPNVVRAVRTDNGVVVSIDDKLHTDARKFVIYRFEGNNDGDYNNPKNIVGVVYNQNGVATFTDTTADAGKEYTYGVTSISPTGVESKDAKKFTVVR